MTKANASVKDFLMRLLKQWWLRKKILRSGRAERVIFYFPGERISYLDDVRVTVYHGGVVEVEHPQEHIMAHLRNTAVVWSQVEFARVVLPKKESSTPLVLYNFD